MSIKHGLTALGMLALTASLPTAPAQAGGPVFLSNVVVDGSLCVGFDCPAAPGFGFSTILMMENNLRVEFQDTSTSAGFPTTDWRLVVNDTCSGCNSFFGIEDADAGRIPFRVEANSIQHALYVENTGDVGMNTNSPVTDLHIVRGNTPTIRLEQNAAGGFTPQTWDVAGNETNFFIRDVTTGSRLPLRIRPGAFTSSIDIAADGDVGMGTGSPDAALHVLRSDTAFQVMAHFENNDPGATGVAYRMTNGALSIDTNNIGGDYRINLVDGDNWEMQLDTDGNLTIDGDFISGATTLNVPDYVFAEDYALMPLDEVAAFVTENRHLPKIPPAAELNKGGLNLPQMQMALLEKVEELTLYTLDQQRTIEALAAQNADQQRTIDGLMQTLDAR